jgi:hypothetical protein
MMVSNDAGFMGASWQPYQAQFDWTLRDTEGRIATLLVYTRFISANGTPLCGGTQISDDLIYDPVPPTVTATLSSVSAAAAAPEGGEQPAAQVELSISASDQENGSGVEEMQISMGDDFSDAIWQPLSSNISVDVAAGQNIYVRVQDGSGNVSPVAIVSIPGPGGTGNFSSDLFLPFTSR